MAVDRDNLRRVLDGLKRDLPQDKALQEAWEKNHVKVLADRGLNLDEIVVAHDETLSPGGDCCFHSLSGAA